MRVASRCVGRADVLLHRGDTERVGARWERDRMDGSGPEPVDLTGWTAVLAMALPDGREVYTVGCAVNENGLAWAEIPASAFAAAVWDARPTGSWRIDATSPDGSWTERLGEGYWHIV